MTIIHQDQDQGDTEKLDAIIWTKSWLSPDFKDTEIFSTD